MSLIIIFSAIVGILNFVLFFFLIFYIFRNRKNEDLMIELLSFGGLLNFFGFLVNIPAMYKVLMSF